MGYYSEVGLCLNKVAHDKMLELLSQQNETLQAEVQEFLTYAEKFVVHEGSDDESVLYHWLWVKWYGSFSEVKFIEEFLEKLTDDDDTPEQYRFVRIGEELEDIEAHGSFYENPFDMDAGRGVYISDSYKPQENTSKT